MNAAENVAPAVPAPLTTTEQLEQCAAGLADAIAIFFGAMALLRELPKSAPLNQALRLVDIAVERIEAERLTINNLCDTLEGQEATHGYLAAPAANTQSVVAR